MLAKDFYLLTSHLNNSLLTSSCYQINIKLANPKIFIKEIFYLFEYAALSENEYYNHLAFSFVEELIFSLNKAKIEQSNWSVPLISLFLTKFNQLGYFNLAISKIYEKADEISVLIASDKQLRQDQLVLILIYLEQRAKENKLLLPVLKKTKKNLSKEKLFDDTFPFDELLRNATLLKLLCFESNETLYMHCMSSGLEILDNKFEDEKRGGAALRKMLFLFDDHLSFAGYSYFQNFFDQDKISFRDVFLLTESVVKKNLEKELKIPRYQKNILNTLEKELNTLDVNNKLDLGFDILMATQECTSEKRAYYSLLN